MGSNLPYPCTSGGSILFLTCIPNIYIIWWFTSFLSRLKHLPKVFITFVLFDFYFSQEPHLMVLRNQVVLGINLGLLHVHLTISHQTQDFKAPGFLIYEHAVIFFNCKTHAPISFLTLAVAPLVLGVCPDWANKLLYSSPEDCVHCHMETSRDPCWEQEKV